MPLLFSDSDPSVRVLDVCALPMLHVHIGIINKAYTELIKIIPEAEDWPRCLNLVREGYHSGSFEGNECRALLKNIDKLEKIIVASEHHDAGIKFISVFESFNRVITLVNEPVVDQIKLERAVMCFRHSWKESEMSLTPKVHLVFDHLIDFVKSKNGRNMSIYSEQSHESLHAKFDKVWAKYKIKDIQQKNYGSHLLRAVLDFNGNYAK